jgi:hypothetical protein
MSNEMNIKEFCRTYRLTEDQFFGREWIEGDLDLSNVLTVPEGFNVKTKGWMDLRSLRSLSEGASLTAGGWMLLSSLTTLPAGVSLTAGTGMILNSLTSISEDVNLTSGSSLALDSLTSISEDVSLISGRWLYAKSLASRPSDFDPLCRWLHLPEGVTFDHFSIPKNKVFTHKNKKYIDADGILSEVLHKRKNIYKHKIIGHEESSYLVYDGENWSHGITLRQAYEDLDYKGKVRDLSEYKDYSLNTELSFSESIGCYRVITGACSEGIKHFVKTNNLEKKSYTIEEIIGLTRNSYGGNRFKNFFS